MISEGPHIIEALSNPLQVALNARLEPGEEVIVAVRGRYSEAFAATPSRMLILKEAGATAAADVFELPMNELASLEVDARTTDGALQWRSGDGKAGDFVFPLADLSKFLRVKSRLDDLISRQSAANEPAAPFGIVAAPPAGPAIDDPASSCPQCEAPLQQGAAWCPGCGLRVHDPCWSCGVLLHPQWQFCPYCGHQPTGPAVARCRTCDADLPPFASFCPHCGEQAAPWCSGCRKPMARAWKRCPWCGDEVASPAGPAPTADEGVTPETEEMGDPPELAQGVQAYMEERYEDAVRLFQEALRQRPNVPAYCVNLAVAYGELEQVDAAIQWYEKALKLNPQEEEALINVGYLYVEREEYDQARDVWERYLELNPEEDDAAEVRSGLQGLDEL